MFINYMQKVQYDGRHCSQNAGHSIPFNAEKFFYFFAKKPASCIKP